MPKRHARLRDYEGQRDVWAGDDIDWAVVRAVPRPRLLCPDPGCNVELASVEAPSNPNAPRYFRVKNKGATDCGHAEVAEGSGGLEGAKHLWMKQEIIKICRRLGFEATPEDWKTRADVFVHDPRFCLEVQHWPTQMRERTRERRSQLADVCWFVCADARGLDDHVFSNPAVKYKVVDPVTKQRVSPWLPEFSGSAQIEVFATRLKLDPDDASKFVSAKASPLDTFLQEILTGTRIWAPRSRTGKWGGWALVEELDIRQSQPRRQAPRPAPPQVPAMPAPAASTTQAMPTPTPRAETPRPRGSWLQRVMQSLRRT